MSKNNEVLTFTALLYILWAMILLALIVVTLV